jgi:prepilin-type N-terminal cleavage/methylation domain-containing protein
MSSSELPKRIRYARRKPESDGGFTLIELLIVTAVIPIIVGALAAGLLAVFSLQSSAASRLGDTSDAQIVSASFAPDVQGAQEITESPSPVCGSQASGEILGLEWGLQLVGGSAQYDDIVSYVVVQSSSTTYNLVRQLCVTNGGTTTQTNTILSYDVPSTLPPPTVTCTAAVVAATCSGITNATVPTWLATSGVEEVSFPIQEPKSNYSYTLTADPAATATVSDAGAPIQVNATTGCNYATPGSGPLASSLCMIDFNNLGNNPALLADAESTGGGCGLEESIPLNGSFTLYFCLSIVNSEAGEIITPFALPTWCDGFLGNPGSSAACGNTGVYPNYYGIAGAPALYQQGTGGGVNDGYITTITLSNINVVNSSGTPAVGWGLFSADAESTDNGSAFQEGITWNSNTNLSVVSNGYTAAAGYCTAGIPCDTTAAPFGTACNGGGSWVVGGTTYYGIAGNAADTTSYASNPGGTDTIVCTVPPTGSLGTLTGTAMVEAITPTTLSATMTDGSGGLEAVVFGVLS